MPQYQQVSGGSCSLTMYLETAPGKVAPGTKGIALALMSESLKKGSSKKPRSVIRGVRGPGKPYAGLPQLSGSFESAAYAPQLGYILRALCGTPTTTAEVGRQLESTAVVEAEAGFVSLPCLAHGFVQDAVITVHGTDNYDGVYRVGQGSTVDTLVIEAPFVAETLTPAARVCRGRAPRLMGAAVDATGGNVALPVDGGYHALNSGESVSISGTTNYDGTHILREGTEGGRLVINDTFVDEDFDGAPVAVPLYHKHEFKLPKRQPTVCFEKYLDFDAGASEKPYRRYHYCKINGIGFSLGGDDELKFSIDLAVGKEVAANAPVDAAPRNLPGITFDNIEASIFVAGQRRGDVEKASIQNSFGITPKAAIGDLGQYSRMPEGDPDCKNTLSVFLENEDMQALVDSSATIPASIVICSIAGEQVDFIYPEAELDSEGPAISGKEGLMQDFTLMPFVDKGGEVLRVQLINRVANYA